MVPYETLFEEAIGVSLTESVFSNKIRIDSIIKDILNSYSDNGISTFKNGKIKLSIKNCKLERNIYSGIIKWTNNIDGQKYFESIINKLKNAIRTEGFKNISISKDGNLKIELTRADNNRIANKNKEDVANIATTGVGTATKIATGGIL